MMTRTLRRLSRFAADRPAGGIPPRAMKKQSRTTQRRDLMARLYGPSWREWNVASRPLRSRKEDPIAFEETRMSHPCRLSPTRWTAWLLALLVAIGTACAQAPAEQHPMTSAAGPGSPGAAASAKREPANV